MMRILAIATLVLVVFSYPGSTGAAVPSRRVRAKCTPKYARLIVGDRRAQVFEASDPPGVDEYSDVYGCASGRGHRYHLGTVPEISSTGGGSITHETLGGSIVAYEENYYEGNRSEQWVVVRDLRTGHLLHRVPTGISENPPEEAGVGYVTETVVKSDGAVAWIVDNFGLDVGLPPETVPYFEVKALDGAGLRTLAGGTDVHPSSLALAGSALYWTQGERAFSALLR